MTITYADFVSSHPKPVAPDKEWRQWNDATGKFSTEAKVFNQVLDSFSTVKLSKRDGNIVEVSISKLKQSDKDYLRELREAERLYLSQMKTWRDTAAIYGVEQQVHAARLEQQVLASRSKLSALQATRTQLLSSQKSASSRARRSHTAIVWENAKQRYRHKLDEHGMRAVVCICGSFAALVLPFAFFAATYNSVLFGIVAGAGTAIVSVAAYKLILCGTDERTEQRICQHRSYKDAARGEDAETRTALVSVELSISSLRDELAPLETCLLIVRRHDKELRKENAFDSVSSRLYNERWRELRGVPFEEFVARVFQHLGYQVEETPTSGDQGVDLIVIDRDRRIAVQVKGYYNSVSNSAIQEVVAGMKLHRCSETCVVTNSRFTKSALELASANQCICIGEDKFQDFVFGRLFQCI